MKKGIITDYKHRRERIILWIVIVLVILIIPMLITMIYVFRHVKYMDVDDRVNHPYQKVCKGTEFKLNTSEGEIDTDDGETLWYSEVIVDKPKAVIIYLGAMKEPSVTYFYGHAALMKEQGYASFLLEVRAHGESSGRKLGLGYTEVEDVRAMVKYIRGQERYKDLPIILHGVSLGGTIAINAVAEINDIAGCIAMSPFASPDDQLDQTLKKWHIPGFLRAAQRPFTHQAFRILYGKERADHMTPLEQIQKVGSKPVLVIASQNDTDIPIENTNLLMTAGKDYAEFWIRQSSDHFIVDGNDLRNVAADKEYCTYIEGFIMKIVLASQSK